MILLALDHTCDCKGLRACNRCDSTGVLVDNCTVCRKSLGDDCDVTRGDTYDGWTVDGVTVCDGCLVLAANEKGRAA